MNSYEADPRKIPSTDRYADVPFYRRYSPRSDDFLPDPDHVNSTSAESLNYWASVLGRCDESVRIYENQDGGRDVFALGSVIVKSSHLKDNLEGRRAHRDYSFADANEVQATALVREAGVKIRVPDIYFASKVNGRDVLVQERLPGVGLNVSWQYIPQSQKVSFRRQAQDVLRQMQAIKPPGPQRDRSYIVPDPDPVEHRGIQELEGDIIFSPNNNDLNLSFMHNDFTPSNIIVKDDKIVGAVDWEMAGFFGWKTAAEVHLRIRTPKRENFAALDLPEDFLNDILFWNSLYDEGYGE